ncbi:class I SAM-dependent methyltransferase [bacterium]|nr:class I SAM-dependent methyltransferase [bacterium]
MECPICNDNKSKRISIKTQEKNKGCEKAFICGKCGTIYLEDYRKNRSYIYKDPDYSPWGKLEEAYQEEIAESKREAFRDQLSLLGRYIFPKGRKLLDIGTGKGYLLEVAKDLGFDVYGVEPSPYTRKVAEEKFPKRIICGLLEDAKYRNGEFDVITMTDVIEYLPSPHSFFDEIYRILKSAGLILIITPNSGSFTRWFLGRHWFQYKYEHIIY